VLVALRPGPARPLREFLNDRVSLHDSALSETGRWTLIGELAAFREVPDSLVGYRKTNEQRVQQEKLVEALRESTRLSTDRYRGGLDSYLQVLDAERNLLQGELDPGCGSRSSCRSCRGIAHWAAAGHPRTCRW
jgi:Outer membrane efflux protein